MPNYNKFFEFTCQLIQTLITRLDPDPDVRTNPFLALEEISELIEIANELLRLINYRHPLEPEQKKAFFTMHFNKVRFYVEQEHLRAHAGWLIDPNDIQNAFYQRTTKQLSQIKLLAAEFQIDIQKPAAFSTGIQWRCGYDSRTIAFKMLNLAVMMRENPSTDLTALHLSDRAQTMLRTHVETPESRYFNPEFFTPIQALHKEHKIFLDESKQVTIPNTLTEADAEKKKIANQENFKNLMDLMDYYRKTNASRSYRYAAMFGLFSVAVAALYTTHWLYQSVDSTRQNKF
jgi:hypothetical protein